MLLNPRGQLENELDTNLPASVIDRLRLGTIHTCKIRCTNKEPLHKAPTTERLLSRPPGGRSPSFRPEEKPCKSEASWVMAARTGAVGEVPGSPLTPTTRNPW